MGYSFYQGVRDKVPTEPFAFKKLWQSFLDGFWALMFPVLILGGIYGGIFNAVEASAISVIYAVVVEVYLHRALKLKEVPAIFGETGVFLGSFLVIMVMALALGEFLEKEEIPAQMVEWIQGKDLEYWQFLLLLNMMLLAVGMMMDILSAMFVFVPLLAPIAASMGVDPIHFGIIFIVNLEIGYLTPPVGLNLFVASALYEKGLGHIIRSVAPFVGLMLIGLGIITWYPQLSVGLGNRIMGDDPMAGSEDGEYDTEEQDDSGMPTMEEMMREAMAGEDSYDDDDDDDDDDSEGDEKEDAVDANDEASPDEGSDDENTE
jgi:C4-dicarboxylate transporter DctM subunit